MDSQLNTMRQYVQSGETMSLVFRLEQLDRLKAAVDYYYFDLIEALKQDLNKVPMESYIMEIGMIYAEIKKLKRELPKFLRPKKVPTSLMHFYSKSHIHQEPYGVVLVIAPWNYPVQLSLIPVIGALAAGNGVILKLSEMAPNVSRVLNELITNTFPEYYIKVMEGDGHVS